MHIQDILTFMYSDFPQVRETFSMVGSMIVELTTTDSTVCNSSAGPWQQASGSARSGSVPGHRGIQPL